MKIDIKIIALSLFVVLNLLAFSLQASGQQTFTISGQVKDQHNHPLPGANVVLNKDFKAVVTDNDGHFIFSNLPSGEYTIEISYIGYKKYAKEISLQNQNISMGPVLLSPKVEALEEVVVSNQLIEKYKKESTQNIEVVTEDYIKMNLSGSLMQSLERLPGISAMDIGSGQSKPVIRGLSFNRVVVAQNGIKHEAQQWGADHGLEIDQYAINQVEVVKGPASLQYGSDAIGGVIDIKQSPVPKENTFGAVVDLTGKSNNNLYGTSINLFGRKEKGFINARLTYNRYGDYRVPTDSIEIYSYKAPLHRNQLRNTAGREMDVHVSTGFINESFSSVFYFSNVFNENGFFANAHGLEPRRVDTKMHDRSDRDIKKPFQDVNHLKAINRTVFYWQKHKLEAELGFQYNQRNERNNYVNHGFMPSIYPDTLNIPENLERKFRKYIYSANLKDHFSLNNHQFSLGINLESQNNRIGGWSFIIPAFQRNTAGIFIVDKLEISENTHVNAGIRYDGGSISTEKHMDWFPSAGMQSGEAQAERMQTEETQSKEIPQSGNESQYLVRAENVERFFHNYSWSLGINHQYNHLSLKLNAGKSFRIPIAKELAANGVNYHHYSYEVGDENLSAEVSYQLDAGLEWNYPGWAFQISPFGSYFPNYIYLNPTADYDYLYGAGNQVFNYQQSRVLRFGGESHFHYRLLESLKAGFIMEYIYSEQLSGEKKGFTLPFSPPPSVLLNLKYMPSNMSSASAHSGVNHSAVTSRFRLTEWLEIINSFVSVDYRITAGQDNIVPPEKKTPGYQVINLSMGSTLNAGNIKMNLNFQVRNLLDNKYFNHTSFYRLIEVPEPGRNFILSLKIPFESSINKTK
mgnify:FL=1